MKAFIMTNHGITMAQQNEFDEMGVTHIVTLSDDLKKVWSQIAPDADRKAVAQTMIDGFLNTAQEGDIVLVQGEFGTTFVVVDYCLQKGLVPMFATSVRRTIEKTLDDGTVEKTAIFDHAGFVPYTKF
jgi:hypothetical protein